MNCQVTLHTCAGPHAQHHAVRSNLHRKVGRIINTLHGLLTCPLLKPITFRYICTLYIGLKQHALQGRPSAAAAAGPAAAGPAGRRRRPMHARRLPGVAQHPARVRSPALATAPAARGRQLRLQRLAAACAGRACHQPRQGSCAPGRRTGWRRARQARAILQAHAPQRPEGCRATQGAATNPKPKPSCRRLPVGLRRGRSRGPRSARAPRRAWRRQRRAWWRPYTPGPQRLRSGRPRRRPAERRPRRPATHPRGWRPRAATAPLARRRRRRARRRALARSRRSARAPAAAAARAPGGGRASGPATSRWLAVLRGACRVARHRRACTAPRSFHTARTLVTRTAGKHPATAQACC